MDQNKERERFRQAVERKKEQAREASHQPARPGHSEDDAALRIEAENRKLIESDRPQDTLSVRAKNAGHGHKTADKWNQ